MIGYHFDIDPAGALWALASSLLMASVVVGAVKLVRRFRQGR